MEKTKTDLKTLFTYTLLFLTTVMVSQPVFFETKFGENGGDFSRSVKQLSDGSIYVLGYSDSGSWGRNDVALSKLSQSGNLLWTKFYGDTLEQYGNWFDVTYDGKFIVTGETGTQANGLDFFIYKIDTAGNLMWSQTYGTNVNESMRHIEETFDKGFILTGFQSDLSASNDTYIVKTDSLGNIQWERWFGGTDNDYGFVAHQLPDSGYVISSDTRSFGNGGYDVNVIRLNKNGNTIWDYYYGDAFQNGCQGLMITTGGKFLSYGETEISTFSPFEFFIELIDTNGTSLWRRTFGGPNADAAFAVVENSDQTFTLTGYSNSIMPGPLNLAVVRVDTSGTVIWARSYGGFSIDIGYDMISSLSGGYLICGHYTDTVSVQFYLLHLDQTGLLTSLEEIPDPLLPLPSPIPFHSHFELDLSFLKNEEINGIGLFDLSGRNVGACFDLEMSPEALKISKKGDFSGMLFVRILTRGGNYVFRTLTY